MHFQKKTLFPLIVLLLASGSLFATWWYGTEGREELAAKPSDRNKQSTHSSAQVLSELYKLRDSKTPREFAAQAHLMIRKDQKVRAAELTQFANEMLKAGFVQTAELCYRKSHLLQPSDTAATLMLARLLYATGRIEESRSLLTELLQNGGIDLLSLPMMGNADLEWPAEFQSIQLHQPELADFAATIGQASIALRQQKIDLAMSIIDIADGHNVAQSRQLVQLRVQCLSRSGRQAELTELLANLPSETLFTNEELLCLQGHLCNNLQETSSSIRCYWEAFRLNPNSYAACVHLAELLQGQQQSEIAALFRKRSEAIRDYENICRQIHTSEFPTEQQLGVAANRAESLLCLREVTAWCSIAEMAYPKSIWPAGQRAEVQTMIQPDDLRFSQIYNWIEVQDFSSYALPDWQKLHTEIDPIRSKNDSAIVFHDDTASSGIVFRYEDAATAGQETSRLFEFTGGGVAVLDIDLDHWPDIFFSQGGSAPELGKPATTPEVQPVVSLSDQLFRNRQGQSFQPVTKPARLMDGGYSQGCTSGDFDLDGFPDLYVANIGQNQLFRNNGDGTFDVSPVPLSETWTTSCTIADLTGDGIPDIYDVNHVVAAGVHQQMCRKLGTSVPCDAGDGLAAEQDRLFAGDGRGGFRDITRNCGIEANDGLGLGLVVLKLEDNPGLSIFVANDARANFLFVNHSTSDHTQFTDEAVLRGVAVSANGRSQACMGVAAGDVDGDGTTDLFITNFFNDYNTLYLQREGFFNDSSDSANLIQGSYKSLGFGTQCLDADLDGNQDLVVANGDVVDFSTEDSSRRYAQQAQFFRNRSRGTFEEQSHLSLGDAFQTMRIGRGLARLDWNADGRLDFVVSHIRSSAMLATNRTAVIGGRIALRLIGTQSPRHPVGTIVKITTTNGHIYRQLTAGDGYMASNENLLIVGLGDQTQPVDLRISWPSGIEEVVPSVPVGSVLTVVEQVTFRSTEHVGEY